MPQIWRATDGRSENEILKMFISYASSSNPSAKYIHLLKATCHDLYFLASDSAFRYRAISKNLGGLPR